MVIKIRNKISNRKKVLITAGPTWVPIDSVRVISNIATGETGVLVADEFSKLGADVTLLIGPVGPVKVNKNIRLMRFNYFNELRRIVKRLLRNRYTLIIHCAAVSDYGITKALKGKLKSNKDKLILKLKPLPKIVKDIRRLAKTAMLVIFKLEHGVSKETLIKRARDALILSRADLVIANMVHPRYKAYLLDRDNIYFAVNSKKDLVNKLSNVVLRD